MTGDKVMNHGEYQRKLKNYSIESLRYVITDCQKAIAANSENPNNSYYSDEICYCGMEIRRRERENKDKVKFGELVQSLVNKGE